DFVGDSSTGTRTITRTFEKASENLSRHGRWRCVFTETKRQTVELQLSMTWVPDPSRTQGTSDSSSSGSRSQTSDQDVISKIRSIKIRSDSTLSELLVGRVDGRRILEGDSIQVTLQPRRVMRNGRYKFRIAFYTMDISRSRFLDHPIFTSFLDIDPDFEPTVCRPHIVPDVCFQFPETANPGSQQHTTTIHAHSSALQGSQYFAQRLAKVIHEKELEGTTFCGIMCAITEFSPSAFRVMLRYLYTGQVRFKKLPEENIHQGRSPASESSKIRLEAQYRESQRASEIGWQRTGVRSPGTVLFEDLYRIAERYEVSGLKELSLEAMQCTLNMTIAISMLAKAPSDLEGLEATHRYDEMEMQAIQRGDGTEKDRYFSRVEVELACSIIKEYVEFFGTKLCRAEYDGQERELTVQEREDMIAYIGDFVLRHIARLWE
ncbi:hypothetical protein BGX28_001262, partial [Mortierella sp. GBA30]